MNRQESDVERQDERSSIGAMSLDPCLQTNDQYDGMERVPSDEIELIFQKIVPAVGEIINHRDEKLKKQCTREIGVILEEKLGPSLEDRLTTHVVEVLDERLQQWQEQTVEKFLVLMLAPNDQFYENLRPLVVRVLSERFHGNLPMNYRDMIQFIAEEQVRCGMTSLLTPGGPFEKDAEPIVARVAKECLRQELWTLLATTAGEEAPEPMERISATVGRDTIDRMRALGGNFSEHVRNALKCYLKALEGQR